MHAFRETEKTQEYNDGGRYQKEVTMPGDLKHPGIHAGEKGAHCKKCKPEAAETFSEKGRRGCCDKYR